VKQKPPYSKLGFSSKRNLSHEKTPSYFPLNPGCLIGILIMAYQKNLYITGPYNPLYTLTNPFLFIAHLDLPWLRLRFNLGFLAPKCGVMLSQRRGGQIIDRLTALDFTCTLKLHS